MNSVKDNIYFMNDFHVDNHIKYLKSNSILIEQIKNFVDNTLSTIPYDEKHKKPILILGGDYADDFDIGFYLIKEYAKKAEHIFLVFGNHDYYLTTQDEMEKFKVSSYKKINEFSKQLNLIPNVTVLEKFKVHEYGDIKIAGDTSWYAVNSFVENRVFNSMRDSECIRDFDIPYAHVNSVMDYKELNEKVNIIVTHVPPIITNSNHKLGKECFSNPLNELKADIYCFGHVHENMLYEKAGVDFITNAYLNKKSKFIKLNLE